jgi:hypothetical protein
VAGHRTEIAAAREAISMSVNPAGTRWYVAEMDNEGNVGAFHGTPWEFNQASMNAGALWVGGYRAIPGSDGSYFCEILMAGASSPGDSFEVHFVTPDRFIATKNGRLYRFGVRI